MLSFLKKDSYLIWKLILVQIGMTMFGLMTSMAASAVDVAIGSEGNVERTCMFWVSVFSILFYMYIIYMTLKEEGQKDKIRLDGGRAEYMPLRGLYIALSAAVPNLILGILIIITGVLGAESGPALGWAGALCGSSKVLASILQAMYWGFMLVVSDVATIAELPSFWFVVIPLPSIACGFISYYFGLTDRGIGKFVKNFFTHEEE